MYVSQYWKPQHSTNTDSPIGELLAILTILSTILAGLLVDRPTLFLLGFCQSPLVLMVVEVSEFPHPSVEYMA
jgi:hypothetical protein